MTYQDLDGTVDAVLDTLGGDISGGLGTVQVDDVQTATTNTESTDNNTTQVASTAFTQQEINGAGGTGLTCASGVCNVDLGATIEVAEVEDDLKFFRECHTLFDVVTAIPATADIPSIWGEFRRAVKIDRVWCETDANTATINIQRDDGTPANILSADLVCDVGEQDSCASGCDVNTILLTEDDLAVGEQLDFVIVSLETVNRINVCVYGLIQ